MNNYDPNYAMGPTTYGAALKRKREEEATAPLVTVEDVQRVTKTTRYEVRLNHSPPLPSKTFDDLRMAKHVVRSHFDCGPLQVVPVSDTEMRFFSTRGQLLATVVVK